MNAMSETKQEFVDPTSNRDNHLAQDVHADYQTELQDGSIANIEHKDGASGTDASANTIDEETAVVIDDKENPSSCHEKVWNLWCQAYEKYSFLILVVIAVLFAKAYPPLGAIYLAPQITSSWIAVIFIFVLSGLGLKSEEFKNAIKQLKFNTFVQTFNFFVDSSVVYGISRLLYKVGALNIALADGMTITSCLPLSISMVIALTVSSNGDEATAVFNAAFGNMVGVFLTPLIIFMYLGSKGSIGLQDVFVKLTLRVLLPIVVGQLLRKFSPQVLAFVNKRKTNFKKYQEWALVYIVYCTFCNTFSAESQAKISEVLTMVAVLLLVLPLLMVMAWYSLGFFFRDKPKLRVMGLFGATHKTVAMGVPLISALYETSPVAGLYTLPILIWHPMQLFLGTFLAPWLSDFVDREEARLQSITAL